MEFASLKELGTVGILAGIIIKVLDIAGVWIKGRYDEKKKSAEDPPKEVQEDRRESNQIIYDKLDRMQTDQTEFSAVMKVDMKAVKDRTKRLEKAVVDGNGQPALVPTVARMDQRLSDHVRDRGIHNSE